MLGRFSEGRGRGVGIVTPRQPELSGWMDGLCIVAVQAEGSARGQTSWV